MSGIQHVFRRLSVYWWRRRLRIGTASCGYLRFEVSLCTKDQAVARSIAPYLTLRSAELVQQIRDGLMTPEEAKQVFMHLVRQETARIDHLELYAPVNPSPPWKRRQGNLEFSAALRLLAAQGWEASVGPDEYKQLIAEGFDEESIQQVRRAIELQQELKLTKVGEDRAAQILSAAGVANVASSRQQVQAIYFRALAAVVRNKSSRWTELAKSDDDLLREAMRQSLHEHPHGANQETAQPTVEVKTSSPSFLGTAYFPPRRMAPRPVPSELNEKREIPIPIVAPQLEPLAPPPRKRAGDLVQIVQEEGAVLVRNDEWGEKLLAQHVALARLLVKFLGHSDPTLISQVDIANFRRSVIRLPKNHGKSPKDHDMTFDALMKKAEGLPSSQTGLSTATMNRYMTQISNIEKICKHAGYPFDDFQGVSGLRFSKKGNKRNERPPFTTSDVDQLLDLPIWSGCHSEGSRLEGGGTVFHDASYWVPLLAIYTSARREEYCGLLLSDINTDAEHPTIRFMHTSVRRLKNFQSERELPLHPELIRLGFLDYVAAMRAAGHELLFPELLAASPNTPMGDVFDDAWQAMRGKALPKAKEEGKTLHSFRHWFNNELKQAGVSSEVRRDILGHLNEDVNEGRYSEPSTPQLMLQAMSKLPVPSAKLNAFPIQLTSWAIEHRKRQPRKRTRPTQSRSTG